MRFLVQSLQAICADEHPLAFNLRVLQIRVLAGPVNRIIVAAEQLSFAAHPRSFVAHGALSHGFF